MKIEYEFDEPDIIYEFDENEPVMQTMITEKKITLEDFIYSDKIILNFQGHAIQAVKRIKSVKKLMDKCYLLTKDWKVIELRYKEIRK
ncbi:MAG TPA: hypothetical protein VMS35_06540 [Nitrososphaeraceae archaeon]|nr:hypothetical protein [Nitrososphaeraceae archaeon]